MLPMNAFMKIAALPCALMAACLNAPGQANDDPFADGPNDRRADLPKMIRVQVEWVEMEHTTMTKLMAGNRVSANDGDLRRACRVLEEEGEATVLETAIVLARPGQKAVVESIQEYIYPTEFSPAELPNDVSISGPGGEGVDVATPTTPTAFETRNLGTTLEVEPNVGADDRVIDLRLSPEIAYHVGDTVWSEWEGKRGDASVKMPKIYSLRVSTGVTLLDGQYLMMAVQSPKDEEGNADFGKKLMIFVRCNVLAAGGDEDANAKGPVKGANVDAG